MNRKKLNKHDTALALCRERLSGFCVAVNPNYWPHQHHKKIIKKLEAVERGEIKRLMIFMPPQHGKSLTTSTLFPPWYMGRNPTKKVVFTSYGQQIANDFGYSVKNILFDPTYSAIFPELELSVDSKSKKDIKFKNGGYYYAVGAGGALTSKGADLILVDDPLKGRKDAQSDLIRKNLQAWYQSVLSTRLSPSGAIVIIQTRWHEDDLSGWLLSREPEKWEVISMPAIDSGGKALWPERYDIDWLLDQKANIGSWEFEALYQQRPTPIEGGLFKKGWWQWYREQPEIEEIVQSWDCAQKVDDDTDYTVGTTWGRAKDGYYLLDIYRDKLEFPQLEQAIIRNYEKFRPNTVLIEDKANGIAVIQNLRQKTRLPVIAYNPKGDKMTRAAAISPLAEAGKVFLPIGKQGIEDFCVELEHFPNGRNDDQVDSTSQALHYMQKRNTAVTPKIRSLG